MLEQIFENDAVYGQIKAGLEKHQGPVLVSGCTDGAKAHLVSTFKGSRKRGDYKIIVTADENKAKEWAGNYRFFGGDAIYFPAKDPLFYSADVHGNAIAKERLKGIESIIKGQGGVFVLSIDALMDRVVPLSQIKKNRVVISLETEISEQEITKEFTAMGYERTPFVEAAGEFAVRGGIIDIYPFTADCPYRIELWGEEVDSIRSFDAQSQRSIEEVKRLTVYPATEIVLSEERIAAGLKKIQAEYEDLAAKFHNAFETDKEVRLTKEYKRLREELSELSMLIGAEGYLPYFYDRLVSFLDYFPEDTVVYVDEPQHVEERGKGFYLEFTESMKSRLEAGYLLPSQMETVSCFEEAFSRLMKQQTVFLSTLASEVKSAPGTETFFMEAKSVQSYNNSFEQLVKDLKRYQKKDYRILVVSPSVTRARRLSEDMRDNGLTVTYEKKLSKDIVPGQIVITPGKLKSGIEYPETKWVLISESDIFSGRKEKRRKKAAFKGKGEKIKNFADISIGDYVVHEKHGVGIYRGIEKITVNNVEKDYISIEYKGGDNLFILASALDQIAKYASANAKKPKLNKLGGNEWKKTTRRVKGQVRETAKELVELYAVRQAKEGYVCEKDTVWQKEFEEMFPYEETQDQLNAIEDVKRDMESTKIMDRLICGDVGYGKTEVAIRAAFKAVTNGKQVAYLVPTTILAQQHYNTFCERFKNYPMTVRVMSRFCSPKEQKETMEGLKKGIVDVVIGTHRLLSKDMKYKDLGLLIIDEEQRFGVGHKEKIKTLKKDVDVLSLSATPIPRTLHMSLIGIRDMSILEEPPHDRRAIQTYVMEYNEELVKEAVHREMTRGGQVYYVYNRVNNIAEITSGLQKLLPEAKVAYAHGQMRERELENIMMQFMEKEIDVLVSTTIIETGLDIPNVNTMIIHDANQLGLSQLYQLRGRVGRSNRNAFAFLMYKRDTLLKETAEKRLQAIREFTDLGSGYKIAMRDLEIRGAGNLLGEEQSGHMEAVGYDLYCKMLNDAVLRLKGELSEDSDFDTALDLNIDAFLPSAYIRNEVEKLELYKRISAIETRDEMEDMQDELLDRFGDLPAAVVNLLHIALLKSMAHHAFMTDVKQKGETVSFEMNPQANVQVEKIPDVLNEFPKELSVSPGERPVFILDLSSLKKSQWLSKIEHCVNSLDALIIR
ncbi:transcription-repair coupling factor [Anaerostipes sp.]|uniref:transcription-repair coupling factor n=1 Tax=Anaerostipes sp. TaxID=1872530 RepID=UPI0025C49C7F|nr:transcription-repair coupling factor [Anaerostipes sp.]MBS7006859.1 transcription-repair coupling factor [Anaerostipes sp.]